MKLMSKMSVITNMRHLLLFAFTIALLPAFAQEETQQAEVIEVEEESIFTEEEQQQAIDLAVEWTTNLSHCESIKELLKMSTLPFALDNRDILFTEDDVKLFYEEVFVRKGKRELTIHETTIHLERQEIIDGAIPLNFIIVKIVLSSEDLKNETIYISINMNDEPKVSGFKD